MKQGGYIAIVSILIIGAFIMLLSIAGGLRAYLLRANISNTYFKEVSYALAESCLEKALLELSRDRDYPGNETVSVGEEECAVVSVTDDGANKVIVASADFQKANTALRLTVLEDDLSVVLWEEE